MMQLWITSILVCVILFRINGATTLYRHSLKKYPGAVCIDGTPASYYDTIKPTNDPGQGDEKRQHAVNDAQKEFKDPAAKNFVIFLEGGGYCHKPGACKWRCGIAPWLCTGGGPKIKQGFGILSSDPIDNPSFYDYFKIDLPYCTGDMYIGRRPASDATLHQHFKGRVVFDAMLDGLLNTTSIGKAVNVVLGGSSAGGAGVAFNCNHLKKRIPHAQVWCIVDAAFYYPVPGPLHNTSHCDSIDRVLSLGADLWHSPEVASFDLHGPWWRSIRQNLFIGSARFDRFGLESYCANITNMADIRDWESGIVEKTQWMEQEDPRVSFFIPACLHHMMLTDTALYSRLRVGAYGLSYSETLWWWVHGHTSVHIWDMCDGNPFCNPQCWNPFSQ